MDIEYRNGEFEWEAGRMDDPGIPGCGRGKGAKERSGTVTNAHYASGPLCSYYACT